MVLLAGPDAWVIAPPQMPGGRGSFTYAAARALGLTGLGRQTNLAERALRRGHGDVELAQALQREAEGKFR